MPAADLPVLIVGDVHGDLQRLFKALVPYPPDQWRTVFLGDLVDGGAFGAGALRYARDRPNSELLLGNHEVAMLWALRDPTRLPYWMGMGGQSHDLEELGRRPDLEAWLRARPILLRLPDGTLAQHTDTDAYARLGDSLGAINAAAGSLLAAGGEPELNDVLAAGGVFRRSAKRLEAWLELAQATRLVHGHTPHARALPDVYADRRAIDFDGGFSRYYGSRHRRRNHSPGATVGPLPPLVD
ncbi:MAG: metallophosphoesterase [Chloroflexota bacterium]